MSNRVAEQEFENLRIALEKAEAKWPGEFDENNTLNDWVTYICMYATESALMRNINTQRQYTCLIKAAGLALTAATRLRTEQIAPRHYDPAT